MKVTCTALHHRFAIETDDDALGEFVLAAFASLSSSIEPVVTYRLERDVGAGTVTAWVDDRELARGAPTPTLARLMSSINVAGIRSASSLPVLHAASVAIGDRAVVVPAAPGAGKSTLCAALVARGACYLTDEAVPVDANGRALPYPKPIVVGRGSWSALPRWRGLSATLGGEHLGAWYLNPARLGSPIATDRVPIAAVVAPHYGEAQRTIVDRMSRAEATATMASNTFNLRDHGRSAIVRFAELSEQVVAIRLRYGDTDAGCRAIEALLDH